MDRFRRWFFFFLLIFMPAFLCHPGSAAVGELADFLPRGAKIVQVIADPAFDNDDDIEYLVLYSLRESFGFVLLDRRAQRYCLVFQKNLGAGALETEGRVQFADTAYTYQILQAADLDGDGILEFWTIFQPKDSPCAELTMYKYRSQHYSQAFSSRAEYDIQLFNYQGQLVIHEVNGKRQGKAGEVTIRSRIWNPRTNELTGGDMVYRMSRKDYLVYARSRRRPQLFSNGRDNGSVAYCWGDSLNLLQEIPRGERAINSLLPENAFLLEMISDSAFNLFIEDSYVFTYQVPDRTDPRRVLLLAAQATWDFEHSRYKLTPLPFQAYGLGRSPEGNLYSSLYVLPGHGFNHLALLGNGERLSSLHMVILNNNGLFFEETAVFDSSFHLHLLERFSFLDYGYFYEIIAADREEGRIRVRRWEAFPEGVYEEIRRFNLKEEEVYNNPREYKSCYYRVEEPVWLADGYEELIFHSLNQPRVDPFTPKIPEHDFSGRLDEYIFKYMTPLRIHQWVYWEEVENGTGEALLLLRTDTAFWPPVYRLGFLYHDGRINLDSIGPSSLVIGEGNPMSGVYQADIDGDSRHELFILRREYDLAAGKTWVHLDILGKNNLYWQRIHSRDIQYDDLRLYKTNDEVWLFGYLRGEPGVIENAVYSFIWDNNRFSYRQKIIVNDFSSFLEGLPGEKIDLFTEKFRLFPGPPGGRRLEDNTVFSAVREENGTVETSLIEKTVEDKIEEEENN